MTIPERHDSGHGTFEWPRRSTGKIEEVPWVRRQLQAQAAARRQTPEARRAANKICNLYILGIVRVKQPVFEFLEQYF